MKIINKYFVSIILIILLSSFSNINTLNLDEKFNDLYYIQKLYPGSDVKDCMMMHYEMKLVFVTLNSKLLYFSPSIENKSQVEGQRIN